jgi:hypothetical protein
MKEKTWRNKKAVGPSKPHSLTCWRRKRCWGRSYNEGGIIPGGLPSSVGVGDWDGQEEGHCIQDLDIEFVVRRQCCREATTLRYHCLW